MSEKPVVRETWEKRTVETTFRDELPILRDGLHITREYDDGITEQVYFIPGWLIDTIISQRQQLELLAGPLESMNWRDFL